LGLIGRNSDLDSDDFTGNHELHAAILPTTSGGVIRGNRVTLAIPKRSNRLGANALADQEVVYDAGPLLGQALIQFVAARAVGIAFDLEIQSGMRSNNTRNPRQRYLCWFFERVFSGVEQNILHINDETARRFGGGQNGVELLQKLLPELVLLSLGLLAQAVCLRCRLTCLLGFGRGLRTGCVGLFSRLLRGSTLFCVLLRLLLGSLLLARSFCCLLLRLVRGLLRRGLPGSRFLALLIER